MKKRSLSKDVRIQCLWSLNYVLVDRLCVFAHDVSGSNLFELFSTTAVRPQRLWILPFIFSHEMDLSSQRQAD